MAGNLKGEVPFQALGKDWCLQFSINGICALEDATGTGFQEFLNHVQGATKSGELKFGDLRRLFWAGLQEHHEEADLKQAGRIITDLGGIEAAQALLETALIAAFPTAPGEDDENPPTG